jgi:tetratricopeptide (TPR) repeat protein
MKCTTLILVLTAMAVSATPVCAQSEAIKGMGRTMHGSDDAQWCGNPAATLEKRIAFCESAVKSGRMEARAELAQLYRVQGEYDAALKMVGWLIDRIGGGQDLDEIQAGIYAQMGRFDDARKVADEMQHGPSDEVDKFNEQCWIRAVAGRELEQGLAACNKALDLKKHTADVLASRALVYFKLGRFQDALADYDTVLDEDSHENSARYARGVVKLRLGDAEGGKKDIADAAARDLVVAREMAGYGVTQ